jgi:predicted Zn-dependent protease
MQVSQSMQRVFRALCALALASTLAACGTNPVTGKQELQFISTSSEIKMGEQAYFPTRQVQGGDYKVSPEVTRYVQGVMSRIAAVSDRDLPFEIEVINSSVPNAWAMPGGKMAINRGLLTELNSEAELAAVLGHEVIHAAARHGAKSQERGILMQTGLIATQIALGDNQYRGLLTGGAVLGLQLTTMKFGRDAELEADQYGMEYMVRAGYDPQAAVDLQETFVRLSAGRESSWLEGLFASHPPSQERVERNRETAQRLSRPDLIYGKERYRKAIAPLLRDAPAYEAADEALKAAKEKDFEKADALIGKAIKLQPKEPKFHGFKGDLALHGKQYKPAIASYDRAIGLYPDYFAFHLQKGYAQRESGDVQGAIKSLETSNKILPTPNAQKALGDLSLTQGNRAAALQYYQSAASSGSDIGQSAMASMARLDLEDNPQNYLKTRLALSSQRTVNILVQNTSPVAVTAVEVAAAYFDQYGNQVSGQKRYRLRGALGPGEQGVIGTGITNGNGLRSAVVSARIVE